MSLGPIGLSSRPSLRRQAARHDVEVFTSQQQFPRIGSWHGDGVSGRDERTG